MARLDPESGCVVVRIVYDGTARSGKTTTLHALGKSLAREVETPAEAQGRTLFFDWLDYTGGRFDGHAIRCQVVSVPGQAALARRRRALLAEADAIVFVADTSAAGYAASLAALTGAFAEIGERNPAVGLVVQANQRDRVDAVPIDRVRADCAALANTLAVTESTAVEGLGVREAFVYAVRLALDRVRELQQNGTLESGRPAVDGAADLLATLQEVDRAAELPIAPEGSVLSGQSAPWPPDRSVPSGLIWPPIAGRIVLHEATERPFAPARLPDGSWANESPADWRLHSELERLYFDLDEGRAALIDWARYHATLARFLSARRCVILARASPGAWRLWQLVAPTRSLEAGLRHAWDEGVPADIAEVLLSLVRRTLDFGTSLANTPLAELATFCNLTVEQGQTVYTGLFPSRLDLATVRSETAPGSDLRRDLARVLEDLRAADGSLAGPVTHEVRRQAQRRGWEGIGESLNRLLAEP